MDETGQTGDSGAADSGTGGDPRDRTLLNGWTTKEGPWSNAGAALDPSTEIPAWRRPAPGTRPYVEDPLTGDPLPREPGPRDPPPHELSPPRDPQPRDPQPRDPQPRDQLPRDPFARDPLARDPVARDPQPREPLEAAPRGGERGPRDRPAPGRPLVQDLPFGADRRFGQDRVLGQDRLLGRDRPAGPGNTNGSGPAGQARSNGSASRWSDSRSRYADLLAHLSPAPNGNPAPALEPPRPDDPLSSGDEIRTAELRPERSATSRFPSSAPPYPYEGDLDDAARRNGGRPPAPDRAAFPAVRPSTPGGRSSPPGGRIADRTAAESARHALEQNTPPGGVPTVGPRGDRPAPGPASSGASAPAQEWSADAGPSRQAYDPASFPRRLPYEAPQPRPGGYEPPPPAGTSGGYVPPAPFASYPPRVDESDARRPDYRASRALPQRVPAEPDVPTVPEPPSVELPAEMPALARIATHLRRGDVLSSSQERQEGFDVQAILAAVREVVGVRDAVLRTAPTGAHSLRLELAEGADPAEVSRLVARLLQDRMGLDAAMTGSDGPFAGAHGGGDAVPAAGSARVDPAFVPAQSVPTGRAPVSGVAAAGAAAAGGAGVAPASGAAPTGSPVSGAGMAGSTVGAAGMAGSPVPPATGRGPVGDPAHRAPPPSARQATAFDAAPGRVPGEVTGSGSYRSGMPERLPADFEPAAPRPLVPGDQPGPRVVIENVQVNTFGTEATVEVRLTVGARAAAGVATGPAVDGYLLRLCAMATAGAIDDLLALSDHVDGPARCYVEHAAAVPFGISEVAVVVVLLSCGGWVEQLAGSAVVVGDDRHAMVRATLAAVNRRLEALLS